VVTHSVAVGPTARLRLMAIALRNRAVVVAKERSALKDYLRIIHLSFLSIR
jgi:hypothetical protein